MEQIACVESSVSDPKTLHVRCARGSSTNTDVCSLRSLPGVDGNRDSAAYYPGGRGSRCHRSSDGLAGTGGLRRWGCGRTLSSARNDTQAQGQSCGDIKAAIHTSVRIANSEWMH